MPLGDKKIEIQEGKYTEGDDRSINLHIDSEDLNGTKSSKKVLLPARAPYNTRHLIGRESYIKDIVYSLEYERPYLLTLTGIGGVGKSSIAYAVCEQLAKSGSFEYIVWISAKETMLTARGIDPLIPELRDLDSLMDKIAVGTGIEKPSDFLQLGTPEKVEIVKAYLSMSKFLIIIDNLETVVFAREIASFIENLPAPSKVLITTREAKLAGEKILNIKEMDETEAIALLQEEARFYKAREIENMSLTQLSIEVKKFGRIPLALTLLAALSAEKIPIGKIGIAIRDSQDSTRLIEFCFTEVYKSLSEVERKVFLVLVLIEESQYRGRPLIERVALSTEISRNASVIKEALDRLERLSWIYREEAEDGEEIYDMLPLTQIFGLNTLPAVSVFADNVRQAYARELVSERQTSDIKRQSEDLYRRLDAKSQQEKNAVYLTQVALVLSTRGQYKRALETVERALAIAPLFPYVYKVKADILFQVKRLDEARAAYLKSYSLGDKRFKPLLRSLVILEREARNYEDMRKYAEELLKTQDDKNVMQILALSVSKQLQDYKRAEILFKNSLNVGAKRIGEVHHNVITLHAMATNYKVWALSTRDLVLKKALLEKAIKTCEGALSYESGNMRCRELKVECEALLPR